MSQSITGRRVLITSVLWNGLGTIAPLLAAFVSIPLLVAELGTARFGVLTIVWLVVGYFSLFDLGLGRALTKLVAERISTEAANEIPVLASSALIFMVGVGLVGGLVLAAGNEWLVLSVLTIPPEMQQETVRATYILAFSVPIVVVSTGLRGLLEAYQRFDMVTLVRLPVGILTYVAPLIAALHAPSLVTVVMALLATRLAAVIAYTAICIRLQPGLASAPLLDATQSKRLIGFGGWMTVSNLVGPMLLYLGRIMVAIYFTAEAVAYFSTPYEVVIKLLLVPAIIVGVLFPAFSNLFVTDIDRGRRLFRRANLSVAAILIGPVTLILFFADWGLATWINDEFAAEGATVARLLAIGVFINSFGHIAQASIQGSGRPEWTAKLHLLELVFYVPYLWWLVVNYGIDGAAVAWVVRVIISTSLLTYLARLAFRKGPIVKS